MLSINTACSSPSPYTVTESTLMSARSSDSCSSDMDADLSVSRLSSSAFFCLASNITTATRDNIIKLISTHLSEQLYVCVGHLNLQVQILKLWPVIKQKINKCTMLLNFLCYVPACLPATAPVKVWFAANIRLPHWLVFINLLSNKVSPNSWSIKSITEASVTLSSLAKDPRSLYCCRELQTTITMRIGQRNI